MRILDNGTPVIRKKDGMTGVVRDNWLYNGKLVYTVVWSDKTSTLGIARSGLKLG